LKALMDTAVRFLQDDPWSNRENPIPNDVGYVEIRERVRQQYERWGDPCPVEGLQNICYFIAVLAHGTPGLAVQNFSPIKRATVWEILHYMREHHFEEIRLVRLVRDRMVDNARRQGMTAEEANMVAKVALYRRPTWVRLPLQGILQILGPKMALHPPGGGEHSTGVWRCGDGITMADDLSLSERRAVHTPMQRER
jgi:hypothetical protein